MKIEQFDFQNWPVYREAILFAQEAYELCAKFSNVGHRRIVDQITRASQSIPLNIAEGSGRFTKADKVNFFRVARGSAFECVACLDLILAMKLSSEMELQGLRCRLVKMGKMLSGLIRFVERGECPPERLRR